MYFEVTLDYHDGGPVETCAMTQEALDQLEDSWNGVEGRPEIKAERISRVAYLAKSHQLPAKALD